MSPTSSFPARRGPSDTAPLLCRFWRTRGQRESNADTDGLAQGWHSGGPGSYTDPNFGYRYKNGSMTAGTLRVIFELGEVSQQDGGTQFILGSRAPNAPCATSQ